MKIILSTSNPSKLHQIKEIFNTLDIEVLGLREAGIQGDAVEDGVTLTENALKKALFAQEQIGGWTMADDSGIFIDALDGQPGIHSARWAGDVSTEEIMNFTLDKLKDVVPENRGATFETVAALVLPDGQHHFFKGSIRGILLTAPRVRCQPNMPYSALFVPNGHQKTWTEMSVEEENSISHRGIAFRQVCNFLSKFQRA